MSESAVQFFWCQKIVCKEKMHTGTFWAKNVQEKFRYSNLKSCGWVKIIEIKLKQVLWFGDLKASLKIFCPFFIQNVPLLNVKCWLFYNRLIYFYQIWTLMYLKNLWRVIAAATTSPGCLNNSPLSSTVDSSGTTFFLVGGPENQTKILAILKNNHH